VKTAILVNGLPASGKTTVSRHLSAARTWPLLTLDSVKEPFFDAFGVGDREHNRALGRAAMAALWAVVGDGPDGAVYVLDAWFGVVTRERLAELIAGAGVGRVLEVWCHAPGEVLAARYVARAGRRHPGHPGPDYAPELARRAGEVSPLRLGPVLEVDSARAVDLAAVEAWIDAARA